jgi:HEPN domain-containing protein
MADISELVKEWIHKANHDLGMAELGISQKPEYTDAICFHCQQAAEKFIKAYLVSLKIPFQKSHSTSYLLDLLSEKMPVDESLYDFAAQLDDYAVEVRYPGLASDPSFEETQNAYNSVLHIKKFVLEKLNTPA